MTVEQVISLASLVISGVLVPAVAVLLKRIDSRSKKREEANRGFNELILSGIKAVGDLSKANTTAIKRGETNGETEAALLAYSRFCEEMHAFTRKQAVQTL